LRRFKLFTFIAIGLSLMALPLMGEIAFAESIKILKIGNTVPMKSKEGIQIKNWLELLAERLNDTGGLVVKGQRYHVKIISYDDEYRADMGRACAERLIYQDKVKHIICQWGSAPIVATVGVAEPNKVFMICNGMTEKTMLSKWHYIYRAPSLFWVQGQRVEYVDHFTKKGLPKTVVTIQPDDVTGRGSTRLLTKVYKNCGVKLLDTLFWKRGTTSYAPFATKIISLNPGFIDAGTTPAGAPILLLAKALYEAGYKGGMILNNVAETCKQIVDKVGPEAVEGAVGDYKDPRKYRNEKKWLELCEAYEKKYGAWETDAVNWIAGWFVFIAAVEKADSLDVDDLVKAMDGLEVDCLDCKRRFVARPDKKNPRTCDSVSEQRPGIVKNGKFQLLKYISIDENYAKTKMALGVKDAFNVE